MDRLAKFQDGNRTKQPGVRGFRVRKIAFLEQSFKAEKVTFWEVGRVFAKVALFAPKTAFPDLGRDFRLFS